MCQSTHAEMAVGLDVHVETISLRLNPESEYYDPKFSEAVEKGKEKGKSMLRQKQYDLAMEGNPTMLIWLGKQVLGQRDRHEIAGDDGKPLFPRELADKMIAAAASKNKVKGN